jgi:uncharacterized protein (UPF0333 family)
MAYSPTGATVLERQVTFHPNQEFSSKRFAGGTIAAQRFVTVDSTGAPTQGTANSARIVGISGDNAKTVGQEMQMRLFWGTVTADDAITAPALVKCGDSGRAVGMVDATVSGTTIKTTGAGLAFTNQPANDGIEVVSSSAADTTQTVTFYGTTTGTNTVVVETVALNGTTVVATTKVDWGVLLGYELSASCAGTVTVREASGDATISTCATTVLSKGVETVTAADQQAFNVAPTAVASGSSTKQIGIVGTNSAGTAIYDSFPLNGTTAVTFATAFKRVTKVLTGDVEATRTAVVKVGAAEDASRKCGIATTSATAQGDRIIVIGVGL